MISTEPNKPSFIAKLIGPRSSRIGLRHYEFSKANLVVVALIVASIGGYYLFTSFAGSPFGDANSDGQVNATDLSILLSKYGTTNTATDFNSDGTTNIIDLSILLSNYGTSVAQPPSSSFAKVYGNPYAPNALNNFRIGDRYNYRPAIRFRADHTGSLEGFRVYWIDGGSKSGYSDGNGGIIKMEIQTDDGTANHFPSGATIGQPIIWRPNLVDVNPGGATAPGGNPVLFQFFTWPSSIPITQGQIYHLVFTNIDSNYANNFYSIDIIVLDKTGGVLPLGDSVQPGLDSTEWGLSYMTSSDSWLNATPESNGNDNSPVLDLKWTDGHHMGNGYMEVWTGKIRTLSSTGNVREQFTPTSSKVVNKLSVAAIAQSTGALSARLETGSGLLVWQSQLSITGDGKQHWYNFTMPSTTLTAGQQYNLVFGAPSGSAKMYAVRDGNRDPFNFDAVTTFSDGKAQELKSGAWANWENNWNTNLVDYADLSFYFSVVN